jgi:hypothetical protein
MIFLSLIVYFIRGIIFYKAGKWFSLRILA